MDVPYRYLDDFHPGEEFELDSREVSEAEIIGFARQFDPQPFHIDPQAAEAHMYGGLIASGWHTVCIMMRMMCDHVFVHASSMGSPGVDKIRWHLPVRPGDRLAVRYRTLEVTPSTSKPDRGVVRSEWRAFNQHGQLVCTLEGLGLFGRRKEDDRAQL